MHLLDKSIDFTEPVKKLVFKFNMGVTELEFDEKYKASALR